MAEDLELIGVGFLVVMGVLMSLWGICALIGRLFHLVEQKQAARAAAACTSAPAPAASSGIPPAHLVAIAAAVHEALEGRRHRIVSVHAPAHDSTAWAQEGRVEQFSSHRVRWSWDISRLGGR